MAPRATTRICVSSRRRPPSRRRPWTSIARPNRAISLHSMLRWTGAGAPALRRGADMNEIRNPRAKGPSILLGRAGAKDPTDLDDAVAAGAFTGLRRAIRDLGPTAVI